MSKHYEERYVRSYGSGDYDEYRNRRRSSSRGRYNDGGDGYRQRLSRSGSGSSISSVSEYEYRGNYASGDRPLVRVPRDIIRAPTPPPVVQRVVERAPTPEPDVVERVIVRPQPQHLIERIIERPRTPPPRIIDKEVSEPAPPPIVRTRIVKVDHSSRHYLNQTPSYQPVKQRTEVYQQRPTALGSYGVQDAYTEYYNYAPLERSYSTSYSAAELMPNTAYVQQQPTTPTIPAVYAGSTNVPVYNQATTQQVYYAPQTYPTTTASVASTAYPYGYSYGYRPVYGQQFQNYAYQRPYAQPTMGVQGY